jgi:hypothetical protein
MLNYVRVGWVCESVSICIYHSTGVLLECLDKSNVDEIGLRMHVCECILDWFCFVWCKRCDTFVLYIVLFLCIKHLWIKSTFVVALNVCVLHCARNTCFLWWLVVLMKFRSKIVGIVTTFLCKTAHYVFFVLLLNTNGKFTQLRRRQAFNPLNLPRL